MRPDFDNRRPRTPMPVYRAMQVTKPGELELSDRELVLPGSGKVRIRVEASGVCHTDAATIARPRPGEPRVPGHEVVGRIDAIGTRVDGWTVRQRGGAGFLGG